MAHASIDNPSDRMLLVLLDEMNLARTEYYFSEFLSKLETRRMVNESIDSDRGRAEIELDMGEYADMGTADYGYIRVTTSCSSGP